MKKCFYCNKTMWPWQDNEHFPPIKGVKTDYYHIKCHDKLEKFKKVLKDLKILPLNYLITTTLIDSS